MHEMSLCESILRTLEEQALAQRYKRVKTVWLEIGQLACVEPSALAFSYEVVTRGTLADGSRLEIVPVAASTWCMQCSAEVRIDALAQPCPHCGSYQLQVTGGDQMRIKELEVE